MKKRLLPLVAVLSLAGCGYNRIQTMDEQVNAAKSQIEVQLQRRSDLIGNLVATVQGITQQERDVFGAVADARARMAGAVASHDVAAMAAANQTMTGALGRLIAVAEAYPELRSSENFRTLQDQIEGTENRISTARQDYNNVVREYNTYIRRFPINLTAKVLGNGPREYFEAEAGASEVPKVDFSRPGARDSTKR